MDFESKVSKTKRERKIFPVPHSFRERDSINDDYFDKGYPALDLQNGKQSPKQNGIIKMDIQPLRDRRDWFRIDDGYINAIRKKKSLIRSFGREVGHTLPEGYESAKELVDMMAEHLTQVYPHMFKQDGKHLYNLVSSDKYNLEDPDDDYINIAGKLVQEDLILIKPKKDLKYYLVAGSLCFPSEWSLLEKIGKNIAEIHSPVPLLNQNLGPIIDRFLNGIRPGQQYWRINFLTTSSPRFSQLKNVKGMNTYQNGDEITKETVDKLYMRNERETFTKLPKTGAILFSLKTYITSFNDLGPITAKKLGMLIQALPKESIRDYKMWSEEERACVVNFLFGKAAKYQQTSKKGINFK